MSGPATPRVRVAAAVIQRADGEVLLAQRPPGKPYAGFWEFPGGKLEPGETGAQALARELHEELGLIVRHAVPWLSTAFAYPHAHVAIQFFRVLAFDGEPHGNDGQAFAWQTPGRYTVAPLLPANTGVLSALTLPPIYGITCASDLGEAPLLARAAVALARGLRMIEVREKTWPRGRRDAFAASLRSLAAPYAASLFLNGAADEARMLGFDGVHWPSATLRSARERPAGLRVAASCHDRAELERAAELGLDFVVMGPVRATASHPDAVPLGWDRLARLIEGTRLPVYALGGLCREDLGAAMTAGAHGIAMRRAAWPEG